MGLLAFGYQCASVESQRAERTTTLRGPPVACAPRSRLGDQALWRVARGVTFQPSSLSSVRRKVIHHRVPHDDFRL